MSRDKSKKQKRYRKGYNPVSSYKHKGWRIGDHNLICDRSGFKINSRDARKEWNGSVVHKDFYEARQPQDFPAILVPERIIEDARAEPTDTFNSVKYFTDADGNVFQSTKINFDLQDNLTESTAAEISAQVPTISNQSFNASPDDAPGTLLGTVSASDPDGGNLTYEIIDGDDVTDEGQTETGIFSIIPTTGALYVNQPSRLDSDLNPTVELMVKVTDDSPGRLTASATITINVSESYSTLLLSYGNVVGYWPVTETSGTTFSDSSGNSNNLSVTAGSWTLNNLSLASGLPGAAPLITTSEDAEWTDSSGDLTNLSKLTCIVWFRYTSGTSTIIQREGSWNFGVSANKFRINIARDPWPTGFTGGIGTQSLSVDTTYFFAFVFDEGDIRAYIDGVEDTVADDDGTIPSTLIDAGVSLQDFHVGNLGTNGYIYHVAAFDKVLTSSEILALYNRGIQS